MLVDGIKGMKQCVTKNHSRISKDAQVMNGDLASIDEQA